MKPATRNNALIEKLEKRSIKPTAMRLLVLEYLVQKDEAVNLSDVEQHFSKSDRTTLYRTLKTFEDKGLVHEIHDLSGSAKYALCADDCSCAYPEDVHVHFYCNSCKKTYCFPDRSVPSISLPDDYQPVSGDFVINGVCPTCRN
ncbi:MAG: transcriptional repressor [Bacteroidetes bacterium]|jgi:Fur family ferric uptake transcriptional regulator|nr:transcriptional repressor [Bacteroidota bacterium]